MFHYQPLAGNYISSEFLLIVSVKTTTITKDECQVVLGSGEGVIISYLLYRKSLEVFGIHVLKSV